MNTENGYFEDPDFNNDEDYYDENYPFGDIDLIELVQIDEKNNLGLDKDGNWYAIKLLFDDEIEVPYQEEDELELDESATLEQIKEEVEMAAKYLDPDINSYFIAGQTSLKIEKNFSSGIFTVIEIQRIKFFQAKLLPIPDETEIIKNATPFEKMTDREIDATIDLMVKPIAKKRFKIPLRDLCVRGSSGPRLIRLGWI